VNDGGRRQEETHLVESLIDRRQEETHLVESLADRPQGAIDPRGWEFRPGRGLISQAGPLGAQARAAIVRHRAWVGQGHDWVCCPKSGSCAGQ
jgi:hypothetical protein